MVLREAQERYPESGIIAVNAAYVTQLFPNPCGMVREEGCRSSAESLQIEVGKAIAIEPNSAEVNISALETLSAAGRTDIGLQHVRNSIERGVRLIPAQRVAFLSHVTSSGRPDLLPRQLGELVELLSLAAEVAPEFLTEEESEISRVIDASVARASLQDVGVESFLIRLTELPVSKKSRLVALGRLTSLGYLGEDTARYLGAVNGRPVISAAFGILAVDIAPEFGSVFRWRSRYPGDEPKSKFSVAIAPPPGARPAMLEMRLPRASSGQAALEAAEFWCSQDNRAWRRTSANQGEAQAVIGRAEVRVIPWPTAPCGENAILKIVLRRTGPGDLGRDDPAERFTVYGAVSQSPERMMGDVSDGPSGMTSRGVVRSESRP
jgi:hypothetical protein